MLKLRDWINIKKLKWTFLLKNPNDIKILKKKIKIKLIGYYIFHNIKLLEKYFKGSTQKLIVKDNLFKIKFFVLSFEC